jgi:hypothetical protein
VFRSLTNREFIDFLEALHEMPWSWRNRTQGGELTVPLTVDAERSRHDGAGSEEALRAFSSCRKILIAGIFIIASEETTRSPRVALQTRFWSSPYPGLTRFPPAQGSGHCLRLFGGDPIRLAVP